MEQQKGKKVLSWLQCFPSGDGWEPVRSLFFFVFFLKFVHQQQQHNRGSHGKQQDRLHQCHLVERKRGGPCNTYQSSSVLENIVFTATLCGFSALK